MRPRHDIALEGEGEADQRQHQRVPGRHVREESNRERKRLGQLPDELDRRHDQKHDRLHEARAARGGR